MNDEKIQQAVGIVLNNFMVGALYLIECDESAAFIYVSFGAPEDKVLRHVEQELQTLLQRSVHLIDIHLLDSPQMVEIIGHTPAVYKEDARFDQYVSQLFVQAAKKDCANKQAMMQRWKETGSVHLQ